MSAHDPLRKFRDLSPGCTGFGDCDCDVCFPPGVEYALSPLNVPPKQTFRIKARIRRIIRRGAFPS